MNTEHNKTETAGSSEAPHTASQNSRHSHDRSSFLKSDFWNSEKGHRTAWGIIAFAVVLIVFQAGMSVGYRKATFSIGGGDRYYRMIGGKPMMPLPGFVRDDFSASHGAAGRIVSVSLPTFIVASPDNVEKTVLVGDKTEIRRFRNAAAPSDILPDNFVVVLGDPDDRGEINAKFIRLIPANSAMSSSSLIEYKIQNNNVR